MDQLKKLGLVGAVATAVVAQVIVPATLDLLLSLGIATGSALIGYRLGAKE